jgi:hypothetical protein
MVTFLPFQNDCTITYVTTSVLASPFKFNVRCNNKNQLFIFINFKFNLHLIVKILLPLLYNYNTKKVKQRKVSIRDTKQIRIITSIKKMTTKTHWIHFLASRGKRQHSSPKVPRTRFGWHKVLSLHYALFPPKLPPLLM